MLQLLLVSLSTLVGGFVAAAFIFSQKWEKHSSVNMVLDFFCNLFNTLPQTSTAPTSDDSPEDVTAPKSKKQSKKGKKKRSTNNAPTASTDADLSETEIVDKKEADNLKSQVEQCQGLLQDSQSRIAALEDQLKTKNKDLQVLEKKSSSLTKAEESVNYLQTQIVDLNETLTLEREKFASEKAHYEKIFSNTSKADGKIKELESTLSSSTATIGEKDNKIELLERNLTRAKNDLKTLEFSNKVITDELSRFVQQSQQSRSNDLETSKKVKDMEARYKRSLNDYEGKLVSLRKEFDIVNKEKDDMSQMVMKMNQTCENYEIKVNDLNKTIASYKSHFEETECDKKSLEESEVQLRAREARLIEQNRLLENQLAASNKAKDDEAREFDRILKESLEEQARYKRLSMDKESELGKVRVLLEQRDQDVSKLLSEKQASSAALSKMSNLEKELAVVTKSLIESESALNEKNNVVAELEGKVQELESNITAMKSSDNSYQFQAELDSLKKQLANTGAEKSLIEAEAKNLKAFNEEQQLKVHSLEKSLSKAEGKLAELKDSKDESLSLSADAIKNLETESVKKDSEIKELKELVQKEVKKAEALDTLLSKFKESLATEKKKIAELEKQHSAETQTSSVKDGKISELEKLLSEKEREVESIKSSSQALSVQLLKTEEQTQTLEKELKEIKTSAALQETEIESATQNLNIEKEKVEFLESCKCEIEKELAQYKEKVQLLESIIANKEETLKKSASDSTLSVKSLEDIIEEKDKEIAEFKKQADEHKKMNESLEKQVTVTKNVLTMRSKQLEEAQEKLRDIEAEAEQLSRSEEESQSERETSPSKTPIKKLMSKLSLRGKRKTSTASASSTGAQ